MIIMFAFAYFHFVKKSQFRSLLLLYFVSDSQLFERWSFQRDDSPFFMSTKKAADPTQS